MKVGIVGGALQGMEAVYLSKKAGYETLVMDRKEKAPARSLSDEFFLGDIIKDPDSVKKILSDCDVIIPAFEESDALCKLNEVVMSMEIPFLFDLSSYNISCSKERSNQIIASLGISLPEPWPQCGYPIIVKPSSQSGSIGVSEVNNDAERVKALKIVTDLHDTPILQEFVSGKSVSIEVIGNGKKSRSYTTTEVILDSNYDCKRVECQPNILSEEEDEEFADIGMKIANSIGLKALMDVEAIRTKKGLRVLEIDARIPSQTPAAIQSATGINLMQELVCSALGKETGVKSSNECSAYEHYVIQGPTMRTCGEKQFGHVENPYFANGLFGEDQIITDYQPGKSQWRATVINHGKTPAQVLEKRKKFISNVMSQCDIEEYIDRSPEMV